MIWLCKASLDIAMNGLEQEEEGQENSNALDDEVGHWTTELLYHLLDLR